MNTARNVIQNALEDGLIYNHANDYAEPGYSLNAGQIGILFANWNDESRYDRETAKFVTVDRTMPRLAKIAERAGYECEWSDEWMICEQCGRAVRTQGDSYGWQPSYREEYCRDCILEDVESYLESLEDNPDTCDTFDVNPGKYGYVRVNDHSYENGWYGGQNDSPQVVAESLRSRGIERFLFTLDSVGQFDMAFSCWVHESEESLLQDQSAPESALPYDPAVEMGKALRGEHSDHYRTETRTLTPEEFASGSWTR